MKPTRVDYVSATTMNGEELGRGSLLLEAVFSEGRGKVPIPGFDIADAWAYEGPEFMHYVVTDLTGTLGLRAGDVTLRGPGTELVLYGLQTITTGKADEPHIHLYVRKDDTL